MCVFRSLTAALIMVVMKTKMRIFNNNEIKGNEELMLLHDQNDEWAVPYPYLMVCRKNIYLRKLFKEAYIA
jgi:hypothetical protein